MIEGSLQESISNFYKDLEEFYKSLEETNKKFSNIKALEDMINLNNIATARLFQLVASVSENTEQLEEEYNIWKRGLDKIIDQYED